MEHEREKWWSSWLEYNKNKQVPGSIPWFPFFPELQPCFFCQDLKQLHKVCEQLTLPPAILPNLPKVYQSWGDFHSTLEKAAALRNLHQLLISSTVKSGKFQMLGHSLDINAEQKRDSLRKYWKNLYFVHPPQVNKHITLNIKKRQQWAMIAKFSSFNLELDFLIG